MIKKRAIIYGIGHLYKEMEGRIAEKYEVIAMVDQCRDSLRKIISMEDAIDFPYDVIIVMLRNVKECFNVIEMLLEEYKIPSYKIELGLNLDVKNGWDRLDINIDGNIIFNKDDVSVATRNIDEFNNIEEIFCGNCYEYFLSDSSKEVIMDIGMNIGGGVFALSPTG